MSTEATETDVTGIDPTEVVRRFNRSYTQRVGALQENFHGTGLSLAAVRVLFEVGATGSGGVTVRDLRERLGLDSGYLSRILTRLTEEGLATVVADRVDGRRRRVHVTRKGRVTLGMIDERSDAVARALVEPLSPRQQERLLDALQTAGLLVRAATVELVELSPDHPRAREALDAYCAELDARFPTGFDPGPMSADDVASLRAPEGVFVVAVSDGAAVACGGVRRLDPETLEIKRMWVDASWRGAGMGSRLLRRLEDEAARLGGSRVVLDTNRTLTEAMAMYERAGYRETAGYDVGNPYAEAWFEKPLSDRKG